MLSSPKFVRYSVAWLMFVATAAATFQAHAQSLRETTSLGFVPADVSFYSSLLRNGEQYEKFVSSRAFAKIKSLPFVQQGLEQLRGELDSGGDLRWVREFYDVPENLELIKLFREAASQEIFIYGDNRFAVWISAMNQFGNSMNMARLNSLQTGADPDEAMRQGMMDLLTKNPELLQVPTMVIGFRIEDDQRVNSQVDRLESLLKQAIEKESPQLKDRLKREGIGDSSFLTLTVDGSLVPWDEVLSDLELSEEQQEELAKKLTQMKLAVAVGMWREYLLLSIGESLEPIRQLGQGDRLVDIKELAPLTNAEGKPVTSIGYVSGEFLRRISAIDQQIDQVVSAVKAVMPLVPIAEDVKTEIQADAAQLAEELKSQVPEMGAVTSYSIMTDDGFESYSYNWSQNSLDGSKPLSILNHLGGSPIAYIAFRKQQDLKAYEFSAKWLGKLVGYAERIAVPFLEPEQRDLFAKIKAAMVPLATRLDKANREKLIPAFADGQRAIVFDAKLTGDNWVMAMPPAANPLPLPEVCCVYGVSDAKLLKEGYAEYFDIMQTALNELAAIMPEQVPPIQLTPPETKTIDAGTIYSYAAPAVVGLDERIAPNAGVSDTNMVLSLVPETTQRMLEERPLASDTSLASADRPLASAWEFKMGAFVEFARPWVDYAFSIAANEGTVDEDVQEQVDVVLDVLGCFRTINGVSYFEDDALVTHAQSKFRDLAE